MDESLVNYEEKFRYLEHLITNIQTNVTFTVSIVVAILGVAVAIAGVALYFIAKSIVNSGMNKKTEEIKKSIYEKLSTEFNGRLIAKVLEIPDGGHINILLNSDFSNIRPSVFIRSHNNKKNFRIIIKDNVISISDTEICVYPKGHEIPFYKVDVLILFPNYQNKSSNEYLEVTTSFGIKSDE